MKNFILLFLTSICLFFTTATSGQTRFPDIDPKWDSFYDKNPSGIEQRFSGSDFIRIIDLVKFNPQSSRVNKDVNLMKKALLMFNEASLRQMMITGNYYSRTFKHDDYFALYNLNYNKITNETWNKYCPYLIPLMELDGTIILK